MHKIKANTPIYRLVAEHPEIKDIMISLSFKNIANPVMLNCGKSDEFEIGAKLMKIDFDIIKKILERNFLLEDNDGELINSEFRHKKLKELIPA